MSDSDTSKDPVPEKGEQEKDLRLYLARFDNTASLLKLKGHPETVSVPLHGEIVIASTTDSEGQPVIEEIRRAALWSDSIDELKGQLSLAGPANEWKFEPGKTGGEVSFAMKIYYPLLSDLEPAYTGSDAVYPQLESLDGQFVWSLQDFTQDRIMLNVTIHIAIFDAKPIGMVEEVIFGPITIPFEQMADHTIEGPKHRSIQVSSDPTSPCFSNGPSIPGTEEYRKLVLRFISISTQASPPCPIDDLAQQLYCRASKIWWENGGVRLDIDPLHTSVITASFENGKVDQDHETGQGGKPGIDKTISPDPAGTNTAVDVYLVDQLTNWPGGGVTHAGGTPAAFIILEIEKACNNKNMLAHEVGHALGLLHPDESVVGFQPGTYRSVMIPDKPNSHRNTLDNYRRITNPSSTTAPVFMSLNQQGGRRDSHPNQLYFHVIRDFPYDDGTETSIPEESASVWWTHSDVWNSTLPAPEINKDYSPKSYTVLYSDINYMYVRLHAQENLGQAVKVYLYLTTPGSASSPLTLLTPETGIPGTSSTNPIEFSGNFAPIPSLPVIQKIAWRVPPGALSHSCVFAIADSVPGGGTPEDASDATGGIGNTPASPTIAAFQLFDLVKRDHNIAQRNLSIPGAPSGFPRPLRINLAWLQFDNPFQRAARARLEIDASEAAGLESLALEVDEEIVCDLKPGERTSVTVAEKLRPEDRKFIRFKATLPPNAKEEMSFPIHLSFVVDGQMVNGYTYIVRAVPLAETVLQVLDLMYGSLRDVAVGCKIDRAQPVIDRVREIALRERNRNSPGCLGFIWKIVRPKNIWRTELDALAPGIAALAQVLDKRDEPECQAIRRRLNELADLLLKSKDTPSPVLIEQVRSLSDYIHQPAVSMVAKLAPA
jgi:hypothetical protein